MPNDTSTSTVTSDVGRTKTREICRSSRSREVLGDISKIDQNTAAVQIVPETLLGARRDLPTPKFTVNLISRDAIEKLFL